MQVALAYLDARLAPIAPNPALALSSADLLSARAECLSSMRSGKSKIVFVKSSAQ